MQDAGTSHCQVQHIKHAASHPHPRKRETKMRRISFETGPHRHRCCLLIILLPPVRPVRCCPLTFKADTPVWRKPCRDRGVINPNMVFLGYRGNFGTAVQHAMLHVSAFVSRHPALSASIMCSYNGRRPTTSLHISNQSHPLLKRVGVGSSIWKFLFERVEIEHSGVKLTRPP
jgi:hypothetical protein